MQIVKYKPAALGLGTESSSKLQPLDFSPNIINRFYNYLGDLEKRRGLLQLGTQITTAFGVTASSVNLTNLHEYIDASGNSTLFASGSVDLQAGQSFGCLWRYNPVSAYWERAFTAGQVRSPYQKLYSVQMGNKLIFCDGARTYPFSILDSITTVSELPVERNISITNPGVAISANYTQQLFSTIVKGIAGSGSTSNLLFDADISNWKTQTNVAVNDLVITTQEKTTNILRGAGIVTSVGTSSLDVTPISSNALGIGFGGTLAADKGYRIVDLVELNLIPTSAAGGEIFDNVAIAGQATSAAAITVTALDLRDAGIRIGDYVYNTTRGAITQITAIGSAAANYPILVQSISGQTAGDSLVFLKDSMPIAAYPHVHYGRLHLIDARDPTKIRVSGPNDPEDFTTFSKTLSSVTIDYGARQSKGDILLTMATFQRYLVVGGKAGLFVTDGTNPIADVTADVIDLDPVGLFPQGVFSPLGLKSIGNEMLYIGNDGLRSFLAAFDSKNTTTNNKSEQIKTEIINALQAQTNPDQVQLIHYPRRNWVMMKIGDVLYNYNYTPIYSNGKVNSVGTFTKFTGLLGQQDAFLVTRAGDLITADSTGRVYTFDVSGVFTDNGANIQTTYISPWHTLQESETNTDIIIKDGRYIKPVFETSAAIKYNISVVGDYDQLATDSVIVTATTSGITNPKMPLRWRGKQAQFTITTDTSVGADIINSYTVYGNIFGRK